MSKSLEFIEKLGFKYAGKWFLDKEKDKIKLDFIESKKALGKILYAFVVGETVMYAGKTDRTLKARMDSYRNEVGGSTNRRIKGEIADILENKIADTLKSGNGKDVLIYVLPNDDIKVSEEINSLITLTAGLEDKVIEKLKELSPDLWNKQVVKK